MRFGKNIVDGIFIERPNRYLARVEVGDEGKGILAHVPDPGRLSGLIWAGRKVLLGRGAAWQFLAKSGAEPEGGKVRKEPADWPTYRGNPARSGLVNSVVPA